MTGAISPSSTGTGMRSTGTFTAPAKAARTNSDGAQISWKRDRLSAKRGGTFDSSQNGRRMLVRPAKAAGPERAHRDIGADEPVAKQIHARAEALAFMLRHAAVLKPRRGVLIEAEQSEGHVGGCKRARRAAQRFANAGLGGRMPDAGDAGSETLRRYDLGLFEERRRHLGAVPADAHERRHGAGAALKPDMPVERPKQGRGKRSRR